MQHPAAAPDAFRTRRQRMRDLLASRESGFDLDEIAVLMDMPRHAVIKDLRHVQRSLRNTDEELQVVPPACTACHFRFNPEEPKAPSRCPVCKSESLTFPVFRVVPAEA